MFYTKYRPQTFSDISRPNEAADVLSKQVVAGKTVHAYLFVGPRGTGKTSTARILAKSLNCEKPQKNGDPCDKCSNCVSIKDGSFIDMIEIDAASNRGIDDIRDLKTKIKLAPALGKSKIYVIDEVHMLTNEAFNALLKTLEEPPRHVVFILCTTESHKVPDTIKSRCQLFKFKRATVGQLVTRLAEIAKSEKLKISESDLEKIAHASLGGFRDAETMLQQIAEGGANISTLLNLSSKDSFVSFTQQLWDRNTSLCFKDIRGVVEEGIDISVWTGELIRYLRDVLYLKSGVPDDFVTTTPEILKEMKTQASTFEITWLVKCLELISEAHTKIKGSVVASLPIELVISELTHDAQQQPTQAFTTPVLPKGPTLKPDSPTTKIFPKSANSGEKSSSSGSSSKDPAAANSAVNEVLAEDPALEEAVVGVAVVDDTSITLEIDEIHQKWPEIVTKIESVNRSILALIKAGKPLRVEGRFLVLEVFYLFHKERIESPKNRQVLEKTLHETLGFPLSIKCEISKEKPKKLMENETGVLTDLNVVQVDKGSVLEMLDGGLPLS